LNPAPELFASPAGYGSKLLGKSDSVPTKTVSDPTKIVSDPTK
jgi:hypothetical protein